MRMEKHLLREVNIAPLHANDTFDLPKKRSLLFFFEQRKLVSMHRYYKTYMHICPIKS